VKVHQEPLARQKMHPSLVTKSIWDERYQDIGNYEKYLSRNGVVVLKFFLHVSKAEQKRRFMERLDNPEKNWKFASSDVAERGHWKEYQEAYEDAIRNTASKEAPWYVVPADNKWFTDLVALQVDAMAGLKTTRGELQAQGNWQQRGAVNAGAASGNRHWLRGWVCCGAGAMGWSAVCLHESSYGSQTTTRL
jgi:hypothetical protein